LRFEETDAALQARKSDLYHRDLAPYADDDLLLRRTSSSPNRLLRHAPELVPQIRETFLADDDESLLQLADDLNLARQLYSPEHEKPVNTILSFMSLLENVNLMRAELNNEEHIKPRLNVLFELLHRDIAYSFPEELLDDAQLTTVFLVDRVQRLYEYASSDRALVGEEAIALGALDNLRLRLGGLFEAIKGRNISYKYVGGMPDSLGEAISHKEAEADSRYISELFAAIRANQSYGVKMGYISEDKLGGALIFSPPLSAADFSDTEELQSAYHPLLDKTEAVAQILHTQRKHHRRVKAQKSEAEGYSYVTLGELGPAAVLSLGPDGELYTRLDCKVSLRDIALQKGKYKAYRELQATVLAHYFDLTYPLEDVARTNKALRENPPQTNPETPQGLESIERLVVPRIKRHHEEAMLDPAILHQEADEGGDQPARSVRRHGVVWHRRKLPEGWNPSPAALELAEKLGVTLGKNETIVKGHQRGKLALGQIIAYLFVSRPEPGVE
jgi:hypothetical protein